MRAVWYDRQGAADEVLVCGELPTPEVGQGEVRVRLEASGVNPSGTYRRRGPPAMEYPRVVTNSDGAGVIDQVGRGVPERWLGKRVWLYNGQRNGRWQGTAAEYIALSVDLVTELPDHVSFAEGATLGVPGMTAHRSVFVAGPVQGKTLLVTGRRRSGGPLRGTARHLGRGESDRHGQLGRKGGPRPRRRRRACHQLSQRGCRHARALHHRRGWGRPHRRG